MKSIPLEDNPKVKDQQGMHLPECPYCHKKFNPLLAWGIKGKGEFHCPSCGMYSDVRLTKSIRFLGLGAIGVALLLLLIFIFTGSTLVFLLPCMLLPFLVFTLIAPFFVRLRTTSHNKRRHPGRK